MKSSISKKTIAFLDSLDESLETEINLHRESDPIDQMIYGSSLRIKALHFHPDLDLMLIVLDNGKVLRRNLSTFTRLKTANINQLTNYELIGKGTGIHWPDLDEDLSLRGFLQEEVTHLSQSIVI